MISISMASFADTDILRAAPGAVPNRRCYGQRLAGIARAVEHGSSSTSMTLPFEELQLRRTPQQALEDTFTTSDASAGVSTATGVGRNRW